MSCNWRGLYGLVFLGFAGVGIYSFSADGTGDPISVGVKNQRIEWWLCIVMGSLCLLLCVEFVLQVRKYDRTLTRFRHIQTLKGAELVRYLTEIGWGKNKR